MELQIEEDFVSPALDLAHDRGSLGVEELHADFQKRFAFLVFEKVEEAESVLCRLEVAGYDYIALHIFLNSASYQRMAGSGLREAGKAGAYSTYATAEAGEGSAEDAMRSYDADYI